MTCVGVELFYRWSLQQKIFDIPNERSSHTRPTVRGGGLIIVSVCLTTYTLYTFYITDNFQWSYLIGASLIAFISWLDDLYNISFGWRFLVHALSASIIILTLGHFQAIYVPFFGKINFGVTGVVLTFLWIVWMTNAYNFMDGIDGIAGMQAVTAGIGWLAIGKLLGVSTTGFYGGVIAFSSLGFLIHNWQPAKIFMGDVGSAFLGYSFAVLPFLSFQEWGENTINQMFLPIIAVLLVWLFVFDTIFTFMRRIFNGEKVWVAHRGHVYQKLVIEGFSHQATTVLYGLFSALIALTTVLWLINKGVWEIVLIFLISFQTLTLLFCLHFIQKGRCQLNQKND
jgi:UDP-N-acetylmuramyl pentapeptide phosphotransferase/UDP-N-acetylglucosamine-1-phosphate transferase